MDVIADLTLTLMVKESVIELSDGLWQSYSLNDIVKSSHFYFLVKNEHKSVSIFYRSAYVDLGISYTLWRSD